jgi:tetratricopeptide (TPR) repeat protein
VWKLAAPGAASFKRKRAPQALARSGIRPRLTRRRKGRRALLFPRQLTIIVDVNAVLVEALAAEREQRWGQSLLLCRQALADPNEQPDAFNLFGRLCLAAGDAANAIAAQRYVLMLVPEHARAAEDLQVALGAIRSASAAAAAFRSAVAQHPDVTCHHRNPGSLLPFVGMDRVEQELRDAVELDPSFAPAHAALGNILARRGRGFDALNAYRLAAMLDWDQADVHLALAAFFDTVRDDENASRHRHEALSRKRLYAAIDTGARRQVLVLAAPGAPTANAPLDFCINHARVALHMYYLTDSGPSPELSDYDLIFNTIEPAESSAIAIERCISFIGSQAKPVINHPKHLANVIRSALPHTLRDVAGTTVPPTRRISRNILQDANDSFAAGDFGFPVVVRPVDTHRGDWQERVTDAAELQDYLTRAPGRHFNVSPFVDYRSSDGYYRKYRVFLIAGKPYPYHLAISDEWKVHYHSSLMEQHPCMRDEEERFLQDPRSVFGAWDTVFGEIAAAIGLEYFGVDCAVDAGGAVLVFECGPNMLAQCQDSPDLFAYKYQHVPRIFAALDDLLERVAQRPGTSREVEKAHPR